MGASGWLDIIISPSQMTAPTELGCQTSCARGVFPYEAQKTMQLGISEESIPAIGLEPGWDCNQAARFLGLHPKTVKRMARAGCSPRRAQDLSPVWTPLKFQVA